jgi:hypothetical protein
VCKRPLLSKDAEDTDQLWIWLLEIVLDTAAPSQAVTPCFAGASKVCAGYFADSCYLYGPINRKQRTFRDVRWCREIEITRYHSAR